MARDDLAELRIEQLETLREEFGLDKPMALQYVDWISGILRGDFGRSIHLRQPVGKLIMECMPITIHLGLPSLILSSTFGILMGLMAALRRGKWVDTVMTVLANLGITVPVFWLGILMIYAFGLQLRWLPIQGYTSPFEDFWLSTRQLIMPVFCLSVFSLSAVARQTRSSVLEIAQQDYIRTAWAKGLSERTVIMRHTLKNGLIPVITLIGLQVRMIFGGQVLVETVFNIPGIGRLMVNAVFGQDYAVVQGGIFIITLIIVLTNLIVDISYSWIDPRIRYK
jgi:peptide/nickel transport system permease protein